MLIHRIQVNNVKRMVLHCAKHVVPSLLLVSERIIVEFGLVGILRLCANNPRPEALKMQRCIQSKCKVFVFHLTFIPSGVPCERGVEVSGTGFQQRVKGVYALDFDIWI